MNERFFLKKTLYLIVVISLLLAAGLVSAGNALAQTGEVKTIKLDTDSSWKSLDSEVKGWTSAAFDDSWWPNSWEASTPIPGLSQAKAIWYPMEPIPTTAYFRKSFHMDGTQIISGRITVILVGRASSNTPDTARVYVNDKFVGETNTNYFYGTIIQDFNLTPFLAVGKNAIAVKVCLQNRLKYPRENYWGLSGEIRYSTASLATPSPAPTPQPPSATSPQQALELGQPYVDLYGQVTDVTVGNEIIAYLSVVNPITSPGKLIIQLTLRIPSGWSITSSGFGHGPGGIRTNKYDIPQGPSPQAINVRILANEPFEGDITGYVDYYFEGKEQKYRDEVTLRVKARSVQSISAPIPAADTSKPVERTPPWVIPTIAIVGVMILILFILVVRRS